jgi:NAD(P)-dependent dehydrogenase (short-subunit alcohol dehydrogenase family)
MLLKNKKRTSDRATDGTRPRDLLSDRLRRGQGPTGAAAPVDDGCSPSTARRVSRGTAEAAGVDALDEFAVEAHVADIVARRQRIDILFNAIGVADTQVASLLDLSVEDIMRPVERGVRSQLITARAVGRRMQTERSGVIMAVTAPAGRGFERRRVRGGVRRHRVTVAHAGRRARACWRAHDRAPLDRVT